MAYRTLCEFREAWEARVTVQLDGLGVPVLGRAHLVANTLAADRPNRSKDPLNLRWLEEEPPRPKAGSRDPSGGPALPRLVTLGAGGLRRPWVAVPDLVARPALETLLEVGLVRELTAEAGHGAGCHVAVAFHACGCVDLGLRMVTRRSEERRVGKECRL